MSTDPAGKIIWIASYPKSGNTWVRWMLCNLMEGRLESASRMTKIIPDIHDMKLPIPAPPHNVMVKTHFPYGPPLPLIEHTAAAVYVIRHPMDVLASNLEYAARAGRTAPEDSVAANKYIDDFIAHRGDPRWIHLRFGELAQHVHSWLDQRPRLPILLLRYEDMLKDTLHAATQLNNFLHLEKAPEELRQAVEDSSFDRMKQVEEADIRNKRDGVFYTPRIQATLDSGRRFMQHGRSGRGSEILSAQQRQRFVEVFGPLMRELNYPTD